MERKWLPIKGIQSKLSLILLVANMLALFMVTMTIVFYENSRYQPDLLLELNIQGDMINEHLDVAMSFDDRVSAKESLAAFSLNKNIPIAMVIASDGTLFASHIIEGYSPPSKLPSEPGHVFYKDRLVLVKEIASANQSLGLLLIEHTTPLWRERMLEYSPFFLVTAFTLILLDLLITLGARKYIVQPLGQLTKMAEKISISHNYRLRADVNSIDEVGILSQTLNELLSVTETNQNSILKSNYQLEKKTLELEGQRGVAEAATMNYKNLVKNHELLLSSAGEGIISLDLSGHITSVNPKAASLLEVDAEDLVSQAISQYFVKGKDVKNRNNDSVLLAYWEQSSIFSSLTNGACCKVENEVWLSQRGNEFNVGYSFSSIVDDDNNCIGGVVMFQDITSRKVAEGKLLELANYDPLTHIANRRYFGNLLEKAITDARGDNRYLALLFIDIDHFKMVNDTYGHHTGDVVLLEVAKKILYCVRSDDVVSRLAGDEFAVLLSNMSGALDAKLVAEDIIRELSMPHIIDTHEVYAQASIGIAMYPAVGDSGEELMHAADSAMYQAKKSGRHRICFYEEKLHQDAETRNHIVQALNVAIAKNEFEIVYQPKINLASCEMIGVEALLRWKCQGEMIPPDVFIPIAEDMGKISEIGEWVLNSVCRQMGVWQRKYKPCLNMRVSVNVSPRQLRTGAFDLTIKNALRNASLSAQCLDIEITETAVMENPDAVVMELERIRNLGVSISIDDFGTGYSSLNYLKKLPIDVLKIDKSFTLDIGNNTNDEAIVKAVIAIAHSMDLEVIAEGVESLEQLMFLQANGCEQVQGYFYSKPLTPEKFEQLLVNDDWKFKKIFSDLNRDPDKSDLMVGLTSTDMYSPNRTRH
ncbi:MAG: EAL domain-containing protein [Pseudomonadales bacterium]|nr:EAL domain-containing protein [Pseudomonadales bacterium]